MHSPRSDSSSLHALDEHALQRYRQQQAIAATCPQVPAVGWTARPPRLLIIEDDVDSAEALVFVLRTMGFEAMAVHDGAAAMPAAERWRPTLILSDLDLPRRDGFELAGDFRAHPTFSRTPLVALSGRALPQDRLRALDAGFTRFLRKPVQPEELRVTICSLLDRRRRPMRHDGPDRRLH